MLYVYTILEIILMIGAAWNIVTKDWACACLFASLANNQLLMILTLQKEKQ